MEPEFIDSSPESLRKLFRPDNILIDLRSEIEVASGALTNATCLPILTTEERAQVGTAYVNQGPEAASNLGFSLVSGDIREERIQLWRKEIETKQVTAMFCWRGGMRSKIAQNWLSEQGIEMPRVHGGYKQLRHFLSAELEEICNERKTYAVWGMTGCAKTSTLAPHATRIGFIDLEALALHRGSAFGGVYSSQPAQATFENSIAISAIRIPQHMPILFEAESKLVGRCALPTVVLQTILNSEMIVVEDSLEARAQRIVDEYIIFLVRSFESQSNEIATLNQSELDPIDALDAFLTNCISRISKKLGGERTKRTTVKLQEAIGEHKRTGDPASHTEWIKIILSEYYDPQYTHQLNMQPTNKLTTRCRPNELLSAIESLIERDVRLGA